MSDKDMPDGVFKHKMKDGLTLLENALFDGKQFVPEIVEFLKPGESIINGEVVKWRAEILDIHLGQNHAEYLLEHQEVIPKEWQGRYYLVFPGTVWQDFNGSRFVPYLDWSVNGWWYLDFGCLERDWDNSTRLVRSREL